MSTFAVDGLASGLQTSTLISQLMQIEAIPKQRLQVQVTEQTTDIKAYQAVASALKKLDDAAAALAKPAAWSVLAATTAGTSLTATARAGAPAGTVAIEVTSLATAARWTGGATLGLDQAGFADPITVTRADGTVATVKPTTATMRGVMEAINADTSLGLTAVAVRVDASSYRLQLVASGTGTAAAPRAVTGLGAGTTQTAATDATWRVGEVEGRSASNLVTDLVSGLDVTLTSVGTTSVTVAQDTAATAKSITDLVAAANEALAEVKRQTSTDGSSKVRGPLASDSMVRNLTTSVMRSVTDMVGTAGAYSLGLQSTRDGALTLDADKLKAALAADPAAVRAVLAPPPVKDAKGVDVPAGGIADRLRAAVDRATNVTTGFLTSAVQGRETTKRSLETQVESWDRRLALREATLSRQFSGMEVALQRLKSQGGWLSAQLGSMSGSNS